MPESPTAVFITHCGIIWLSPMPWMLANVRNRSFSHLTASLSGSAAMAATLRIAQPSSHAQREARVVHYPHRALRAELLQLVRSRTHVWRGALDELHVEGELGRNDVDWRGEDFGLDGILRVHEIEPAVVLRPELKHPAVVFDGCEKRTSAKRRYGADGVFHRSILSDSF